jgi:hypothetical protein
VALWALGFVRVSVRARNGGCGSGSSLTLGLVSSKLSFKLTPPPSKQIIHGAKGVRVTWRQGCPQSAGKNPTAKMNNNGANNEQWRVGGCKRSTTGGVRNSPRQTENNGTYSNEGDQAQQTQSRKPGVRKYPTVNSNKAGASAGLTKINGKRHVGSDTPNKEDGMEHYSVKAGFVDVRFMCGNGEGFIVARGLKQFISAARVVDKDFCLLPLGGQDNNLCIRADMPNSKEGIHKYFRHRVSINNVAGIINIQNKFSFSRLKHPSSTFQQYLNKEKVHINSAQLGVEEGVTIGWCWKSHPSFGYRDEMKSRLKLMMGKAHEDTSYDLFPKNIRYVRKSDGAKLSTTGIALRIAKRPGVSEQLFREELAPRWSNLTI